MVKYPRRCIYVQPEDWDEIKAEVVGLKNQISQILALLQSTKKKEMSVVIKAGKVTDVEVDLVPESIELQPDIVLK